MLMCCSQSQFNGILKTELIFDVLFFRYGQNLKYLELDYIDIANDWGLEQLTKLKSLEVLKMKLFRTATMDNLVPFGYCQNLKLLNIEADYSSFSAEKVSAFLKNNRRPLKKLCFQKPDLTLISKFFHFTAEWSDR